MTILIIALLASIVLVQIYCTNNNIEEGVQLIIGMSIGYIGSFIICMIAITWMYE